MFYHLGEEKTRRRERTRALFARRALTMKQWSLDARSRGQPWPLPIKEKRKRGRRISIFTPVLVQCAVSEDPRWTRALGNHLARLQGEGWKSGALDGRT